MPGKVRARAGVTLLALAVLIVGSLAVEGGACLVYRWRMTRPAVLPSLDAYEEAVPGAPGRWRLRQGYSGTLGDLINEKQAAGRVLAVEFLEERGRALGIGREEVILQVNSAGFKGPEIDASRSRPRILTLGDSCTFGTPFDRFSYPRVLEETLKERGVDVEVINGGVEGYSVRSILERLPEYLALEPDVVTVYVGWNDIFGDEMALPRITSRSCALRLARSALRRATERLLGPERAALRQLEKEKRPDRNSREVAAAGRYVPSRLADLERLLDGLRDAGAQAVLFTLPGLFVPEEAPGPAALDRGHLPTFTDNPYVLAAMTGGFNNTVRAIGRERGIPVVDLERWSLETLRPREDYFLDSVHLFEEGQAMIGRHLAGELAPYLSRGGESY